MIRIQENRGGFVFVWIRFKLLGFGFKMPAHHWSRQQIEIPATLSGPGHEIKVNFIFSAQIYHVSLKKVWNYNIFLPL